uniref:General transcription factor IIA, 1 n=1 Tax=Esox lucius TaxID=8010 RepID=A0A3P8XPV2_ESOLU
MASTSPLSTVPKLYRSVIEDVINEVRELFLDEGVDEQVLMELKTLWENKLMQSKAVEGFHTEEQAALQAAAQQQAQQSQQVTQQTQSQQVLLPQQQQAPQQQVIVQDPKILQHMSATGMVSGPGQSLIRSKTQIMTVVRAANGAQYIIQPQQQMVLQQQVLPQMQPGGVQAPVIQQVLTPLQGGLPQQTGVIIQPQQIVLTGNKVQQNTQQVQQAQGGAAQGAPQQQQQPQAQGGAAPGAPQQQQAQQMTQPQPPMMLQVDGAGDTSSDEDEEEEEEEYDEDEDEDKDKDGGEDGQVEEEPLNSEDDVSDEEDQELFDTENVVVCQYDKIHRSKNKWKFHLKDGIMNLNGRDYVFSKAVGDAEW